MFSKKEGEEILDDIINFLKSHWKLLNKKQGNYFYLCGRK